MEPNFINGLRVTDKDTMEIAEMVLAKGKQGTCYYGGISRRTGCWYQRKRRWSAPVPEKKLSKGEDIGYVGDITKVNPKILQDLLERDFLPIVFPIGLMIILILTILMRMMQHAPLQRLFMQRSLHSFLILKAFTKTKMIRPALISELHVDEAQKTDHRRYVGGGMIPKLKNCIDAIEEGVNRVHILDGRIPHSLLLEIFTNKGIGTAILREDGEKYYNEHE